MNYRSYIEKTLPTDLVINEQQWLPLLLVKTPIALNFRIQGRWVHPDEVAMVLLYELLQHLDQVLVSAMA